MNDNKQGPEEFFEINGDFEVDEDGIYSSQKEYFKTPKGRRALKRARQKYDKENPDKRRKQKRDYMRRKRDKDPDAWRD